MAILTIWEYLVGLILEEIYEIKYWDYSHKKFNFQGRICLSQSIMWGVLGTVFITVIHPIIYKILENVPKNIVNAWTIILSFVIFVDFIFTIIKLANITISMNSLREITETLKFKTEELKEALDSNIARPINTKLIDTIEELKIRQESLKAILEKRTRRLRNAFPTMKLKEIGEAINSRIKKLRGE